MKKTMTNEVKMQMLACMAILVLLILAAACGCTGSSNTQKQTKTVSNQNYLIKDITDPSKSTTTEDHTGELYKNTIKFGKGGYSTYEIDISGIAPPIYITLSYTVDETTRLKHYQSSYGNKEYKTEEITIPDPNAYFDLTITDIMDKEVAKEGYGQQMSHDINLKDKIRILEDGNSYKLVMNGFNIVTDIVISK